LIGSRNQSLRYFLKYPLIGVAITPDGNYSRPDNLIWMLGAYLEKKNKESNVQIITVYSAAATRTHTATSRSTRHTPEVGVTHPAGRQYQPGGSSAPDSGGAGCTIAERLTGRCVTTSRRIPIRHRLEPEGAEKEM